MPRPRDEEGFTLIELLVAMMIMLIITVPLVTSFVLGIQTTTQSQQDVVSSTDAQLLSEYFDIDVANSEAVDTAGGCSGAGSRVLVLSWNDAGANTVVDYSLVADPAAQTELALAPTIVYRLERHRCAAAGGAVVETTEVGHQLIDEGSTLAAAATCDGGCAAGSHPRLVTLRLQESSKLVTDKGSATVFTFGITATRKVTTP